MVRRLTCVQTGCCLQEKIEAIATKVYGAASVEFSPEVRTAFACNNWLHVGVCVHTRAATHSTARLS